MGERLSIWSLQRYNTMTLGGSFSSPQDGNTV